jgi:hypothetical protein
MVKAIDQRSNRIAQQVVLFNLSLRIRSCAWPTCAFTIDLRSPGVRKKIFCQATEAAGMVDRFVEVVVRRADQLSKSAA